MKDRWTDRLYKLREAELGNLLKEIRPECILIDFLQSTDFVVLYPYAKAHGIKIAFIQTMLPQVLRKDTPPINSLAVPEDKRGVQLALFSFHMIRFAKLLMAGIKYFGKVSPVLIHRRFRINQINKSYRSTRVAPLSVHFENIDEFILAPREFDFPRTSISVFEHYVGFMFDEERREVFGNDYKAIQGLVRSSNNLIVYCSFGTVRPEDIGRVESFVKNLINAVKGKDYLLIVSAVFAKQLMATIG